MSGPVGDERDQIGVGAFLRRGQFVEHRADAVHHLKVGALRVAADVVGLPCAPGFEHPLDGGAVIFDMQPVPDIRTGTVHRQRLAGQRVERHQRDQLFRELTGAVVVGAVGDQGGEPIGFVVGAHEMVAGRLACGIGAVRTVGSFFGKCGIAGEQRAEDFVGGHMQEPKSRLPRFGKPVPPCIRRAQQRACTEYVGPHKRVGIDDGTIHMALRSEIDHRIGFVRMQQKLDQLRIADIAMHKKMVRIVPQGGKVIRIPGIGQLVEIDHPIAGRAARKHIAGADEPGAPGHENGSHGTFLSAYKKLKRRRRRPSRCPKTYQTSTTPSSPLSAPFPDPGAG